MSALIYCPFPDRESAREAVNALLDERLIACANILGEIESLFEWEGKRDSTNELAVLFKTDAALLSQAVERLASIHPYDTPAVMGWRCDTTPMVVQEWLGALTSRP